MLTAAKPDWRKVFAVRPQDVGWLVLFGALAFFGPERTPVTAIFIPMLAFFQVIEAKTPFFSTERGNLVSILIKLGLGYLLIGFTKGVASSYYLFCSCL